MKYIMDTNYVAEAAYNPPDYEPGLEVIKISTTWQNSGTTSLEPWTVLADTKNV
jgi:hypothetical protein